MIERVEAFDWASTPLGPKDQWPPSLRTAVDICLHSRFPMFVWWGPEHVQIYNDGYAPMLGRRHPAALGRPAAQTWADIWSIVGPQGEAVLKRGEATWNDRVLLRMERQGYPEDTYFTWSYSPIRDESGGVGGLFCAVIEETARVKAEEAVQLHSRVLASMTEGVSVADERGAIIYTNAAEDEMFGYAPGELLGRHVSVQNAYDPEENDRIVAGVIEKLKADGAWSGEWHNRRKDGRTFYTHAQITALQTDTGRPLWVCVQRDVTERKRNEQALRESEQRLKAVTNLLPAFVWMSDADGHVHHLNDRWYGYTGLTPEQSHGSGWTRAVHPEDRAQCLAAWADARAAGAEYEVEMRYRRHDGAYRWYVARATPWRDAAGRVTGWIGTSADIHDRKLTEAALERAQERLRVAQQASQSGAWDWDCVTGEVAWTEQYFDVYGLDMATTPPSFENWLACIHPEDRPAAERAGHAALSPPGRLYVEFRREHPERGLRWLAAIGQTTFDDAGRPLRMAGLSLDITAKKQAEEAVRRSEERLRTVLEHLPVGVWFTDETGKIVFGNPAGKRIWGGSRDVGLDGYGDYKARWHETGVPLAAEDWALARAMRDGAVSAGEIIDIECFDGTRKTISNSATPIRDADGRVVGAVAINEDVTERIRAVRALRESEGRLRLALAGAPICVYANDADLRYTWIYNPREGFTQEQMVGKRDEELLPQECVAELVALKREAMAAGRRIRRQITATIDGAEFTYDVTVEPQHDAAGRPTGLMAAVLDVSELVRARREAEAASQAKDRFIAVLSHELRTPLTPVLMAAQMLDAQATNPQQVREAARMIRRNVELEARLIDDLLDLTRIRRGKLELHLADVDLNEQVRQVVGMCEEEVAAKRLSLDLRLAAGLRPVTADPARVQQVVWNLLRNAIKFTPAAGRVTVSTAGDGARVTLRVEDTGIGIPAETLPRVFDAFEQGGREVTRQFGGLGLGLAISKAVVELHGGTIAAASDGPGAGAAFTVCLPVADSARAAPSVAPAESNRQGLECSILLVEDHDDTRQLLAMLLTGMGCSVTTAGSASEAIAVARTSKFNLIVSDLGLPDASGLDLVAKLRDGRDGVRAIALSGYGMEDDIRRTRAAGFDAHLTKPVDFDELEAVIRQMMTGR